MQIVERLFFGDKDVSLTVLKGKQLEQAKKKSVYNKRIRRTDEEDREPCARFELAV